MPSTRALAQDVQLRCLTGLPFRESSPPEGKKKSRNSVVLMRDSGKLWAGHVSFFLSHTPPGVGIVLSIEGLGGLQLWTKRLDSGPLPGLTAGLVRLQGS
ncbi:hypothetical protein WJX77_012456 [Trebouxia sp. C0004]